MRVAFAFAAVIACGGCSLDVCREHPPAVEIEITVNDDVDVKLTNLEVRIEYANERFLRDYEVGDALDDGMTSIGVDLDPAPVDEIRAHVEVRGRADPSPQSPVVAFDEEGFELSADGCNLLPITLDTPDD